MSTGFALERVEIAVEQKPDLARVRGSGDETERHRSMVERGPRCLQRAFLDAPAKSGKHV